jgi:hypothetical protein
MEERRDDGQSGRKSKGDALNLMVHVVRPTICSFQSDGTRDVVLVDVSVTSAKEW